MKILENKFFQFLTFVLMIVVIVFFVTLISNKSKAGQDNVITVTGTGEIYVSPDVGVVDISVLTENKEVAAATSENSEKMNNVTSFLKGEGVDEKDIKTTGFNINPRYEYQDKTGKRNLAGYEVSQTIRVKIRDLSKVGKIISQSAEKGANNISSLSFVVDNDEVVKEEAKKIAINNAKEKAKNLEKALGIKISKIVNFSENSYVPYAYDNYSGAGKMLESAVVVSNIETGQNKITSTVVITYSIK